MRSSRTLVRFVVGVAALATVAAMPVAAGAQSIKGASVNMQIKRFSYLPHRVQAQPGTQVSVFNVDGARFGEPHSVTANDKSFDTGLVFADPVQFTAPSTPGTYRFHCKVHPFMHGELIVSSS